MLRRTFTLDDGRQALVVVDPNTTEVHLAVRDASWDQWSRPLEEDLDAREDDAVVTGPMRAYGSDGRQYTLTPLDESTQESSAQITTEQ